MASPVPKTVALQHRGYMELVRSLACDRCGWPPRSQFCHSDEGKGGSIKSDCRLGWPGCGPHRDPFSVTGLMVAGCHHDIGTKRVLPKAERRLFEASAARRTRDRIWSAGLWPRDLPCWPDDEVPE